MKQSADHTLQNIYSWTPIKQNLYDQNCFILCKKFFTLSFQTKYLAIGKTLLCHMEFYK